MLIQTKFEIGDTVWAVHMANIWLPSRKVELTRIHVIISKSLQAESYTIRGSPEVVRSGNLFSSRGEAKRECKLRNVRAANIVKVQRVHEDGRV